MEARRRYLLESRALDPQRQNLLLVLSGLELRSPRRAIATAAFCPIVLTARVSHHPSASSLFG
jgi:hypothetical protein